MAIDIAHQLYYVDVVDPNYERLRLVGDLK
jgi:hypothetical protein